MADYKNIVSFIRKVEGGLSSATTDTASKNPSPCGNGKNGKQYLEAFILEFIDKFLK